MGVYFKNLTIRQAEIIKALALIDNEIINVPEPHGNLIDGDALFKEMIKDYNEGMYDKMLDVIADVQIAPTVIEAEGER